jgi:hypothetical protein
VARTTTVTVLFCDLVGSTALQSRIGDDAADDVHRAFFGVLRVAFLRDPTRHFNAGKCEAQPPPVAFACI